MGEGGRRPGTTRVWTRLVAIALVPLLGLVAFASQAAVSRWRLAASSDALSVAVDRLAALVPTERLVTQEVYLLSALGFGQSHGMSARAVGTLVGMDLTASLRNVENGLDRRLALLPVGDPATAYRGQLENIRREVERGSASLTALAFAVGGVAGALNNEAARTMAAVSQKALGVNGSAAVQQALAALAAAHQGGYATFEQLSDAAHLLTDVGDQTAWMRQLRDVTAQLDQAGADLSRLATGVVAQAWRRLSTDTANRADEAAFAALGAADTSGAQHMVTAQAATMFKQGIARLDRYYDLTQLATSTANDASRLLETNATRQAWATLGGTAGLVLLTLLIAALVARSIGEPLRRLSAGAARVSEGDLDDEVVGGGPRELQAVTSTFAEVVANLRVVEAQVGALAAGALDHAILDRPVPGRLGALLHESVARLSQSMAEREQLAVRLAHDARHDALTGLPNRTAATEELERALARSQRDGAAMATLYVDLDGFKHVNDNLGHDAGDAVLRETAQRLTDSVRTGDFVARIGGDEFIVITERASDPSELVALGERIVARLSDPVEVGVDITRVGASVGIALAVDGQSDADGVLRDADLAVYQAKGSGRGRVEMFDEGLRAELARRAEVERALRIALSGDELQLHFQPVVDASGAARDVEALLRWDRPGFGLVPPGEFIPIAEATDLIIDVGRWVLDRACRHVAEWAGDPVLRDLTVSVNLSGRHLLNLTVVDDVRDALTRHGVPPDRLVVEISETVLLTDVPTVSDHLDELRKMGVRVAIDDFGTGYTSLAHLRSLPVDVLKIDRSMVIPSDREPGARVLALLTGTAHALGLRVVAEGVETPQQLDNMRQAGCDSIQGFLFSRPLPVADLRVYLADRLTEGTASSRS